MRKNYMNDSEEPRKVEFPTIGDYRVLDNLLGLRRVFPIHQRILEKTGESYPYYPDEIREYSANYDIYHLWEEEEYEFIEEVYVEAWIAEVEFVSQNYLYFSIEEFIDGTAEIVLK